MPSFRGSGTNGMRSSMSEMMFGGAQLSSSLRGSKQLRTSSKRRQQQLQQSQQDTSFTTQTEEGDLCGSKDAQIVVAAARGDYDQVMELINNGADVNVKDLSHQTALICASSAGHFNIVKLLVENKADINLTNGYHSTALMFALFNKHPDIAEFLLTRTHPFYINHRNYKGTTALYEAARCNYVNLVLMMLEMGADPYLKRRDGTAAINVADPATAKFIGNFSSSQQEALVQTVQMPPQPEIFMKKIVKQDDDEDKSLDQHLDKVARTVRNVSQVKVFYTYLRHLQASNAIDARKVYWNLRNAFTQAEVATDAACTSLELILNKAFQDANIDERTKTLLESNKAINQDVSNSHFGMDIAEDFQELEAAYEKLTEKAESAHDNLMKTKIKIEVLWSSVQQVQAAMERNAPVEAAAGFVGCVLQALSFFCAAQSEAKGGAMSKAMSQIVDFGDLKHIQSVVEGIPDNDELLQAIQLGIKTASVLAQPMTPDEAMNKLVTSLSSCDGSAVNSSSSSSKLGEETTSLVALVFVAKAAAATATTSTVSSCTNPKPPVEATPQDPKPPVEAVPQDQMAPVEAVPQDPKPPVEAVPQDPKPPVEVVPQDPKPPVEAVPQDPKPVEAKHRDPKPVEAKPRDPKPVEAKPQDLKTVVPLIPAEQRPRNNSLADRLIRVEERLGMASPQNELVNRIAFLEENLFGETKKMVGLSQRIKNLEDGLFDDRVNRLEIEIGMASPESKLLSRIAFMEQNVLGTVDEKAPLSQRIQNLEDIL